MGQAGLGTMAGLAAVGSSAALASLLLMSADEQVAAADSAVCRYEKAIVLKAIEAHRLSNDEFTYPWPAGPDGLDAVRASDWLRSESGYWRYTGLDAQRKPVVVLRRPVGGCS